MSEIEKSVRDIAKDLGIDHEYVLRRTKLLADNSVDDNVSLRATMKLGEYIGTDGMKQKTTTVFGMLGDIRPGFSLEQVSAARRLEPKSKEITDGKDIEQREHDGVGEEDSSIREEGIDITQ